MAETCYRPVTRMVAVAPQYAAPAPQAVAPTSQAVAPTGQAAPSKQG